MRASDIPARQDLRFVETAEPIREPVTKLGGQPVWLDTPTWPLSAALGRPMRFIGQIRLPGDDLRLSYLFLADEDDEDEPRSWDPRAGENAFFAQPGETADFYQVASIRSGPTAGPDHLVELTPYQPAARAPRQDVRSRLWGEPGWLDGEQFPDEPGQWRFVLQLDSTDDLPFGLEFGAAGIGYGFLDEVTGQGRFLWQCL